MYKPVKLSTTLCQVRGLGLPWLLTSDRGLPLLLLSCLLLSPPAEVNTLVSGDQGIRGSGDQGIRVSGYQGIRGSGDQGIRVSGDQGIKGSYLNWGGQ